MKKNIVIFVPTIGSGGAEKQAALLAQVLSKHYQVHFVVLYGELEKSDYVSTVLARAKVNVYPLAGSQIEKFKEFAKIIKTNKVFCAFNYLTKCDFWGAIIENLCGVELIYNGIRNSKLDSYKNILEWISHNFIATGTIFNCYSGEAAFIKKGFRKNKCITISNCFPIIEDPIVKTSSKKPHIITIARFHPQKDYETTIKAISLLKNYCKDFVFDLCGYGNLENQIRAWVRQYEVDDVVVFHIHPNNIPELLQNADIYLSTSLYEGTSNSIMEAMNWCLPVVATNVGDNYKLLEKQNEYLAEVGDAETLAIAMKQLLQEASIRENIGINNNKYLRENFSIEIFETKYLKLIQERGL